MRFQKIFLLLIILGTSFLFPEPPGFANTASETSLYACGNVIVSSTNVIAFRRGFARNIKFSENIFSNRDWSFKDYLMFVIAALSSITFVICIHLMLFSENSRIPEDILFSVAVFCFAIGMPWYLSLFSLPPNIKRFTQVFFAILFFWSGFSLFRAYRRYRQDRQKPSIFID